VQKVAVALRATVPSSDGPDYFVVRASEARRKQISNIPLLAAGFFIHF
jgi:hypothetical protein